MTITIRNKNNQVIGTADSINIVSKYKDIDVTKQGIYNEKILETNFSLLNPCYHPYYNLYRDNLNIEAKVGIINNLSISSNQIINLTNCTLIKDYFGTAKDFKIINLYNLESIFNYYFPNFEYNIWDNSSSLQADIISNNLFNLFISNVNFEDKWRAKLYFGHKESILIYESTDLNKLMQVTKQKLNDMFADWMNKVN